MDQYQHTQAPMPPVGPEPRFARDAKRAMDLLSAMAACVSKWEPIPPEWYDELRALEATRTGRQP